MRGGGRTARGWKDRMYWSSCVAVMVAIIAIISGAVVWVVLGWCAASGLSDFLTEG